MSNDKTLSKFISLILRHKPETVGITLDENGWANVEELLCGIRQSGQLIDFATLEKIVRENDKQRFSFNDDKTKIRANQGHSIQVDVELEEKIPPNFLYHGTIERNANSIDAQGKYEKENFVNRWKELEFLCNKNFHPRKETPLDDLFMRYMYYLLAKSGTRNNNIFVGLRNFYEKNNYAILQNTQVFEDLITLGTFGMMSPIATRNGFLSVY